jgi:hypothetical protein
MGLRGRDRIPDRFANASKAFDQSRCPPESLCLRGVAHVAAGRGQDLDLRP